MHHAEIPMRTHVRPRINSSLLSTVGGLALVFAQSCANGDAKQTEKNASATGGAPVTQGGAPSGGASSTTGTSSSQGGISIGDTGQGGTTVSDGGTGFGGDSSTGGQAIATGGADDGQGGATMATGGESATGGANTGGMATGGSPWSDCTTSLDCVGAPNSMTICDTSNGSCVECAQPADCGANFDCTANKCVHYDPCVTSPDCPDNQACDTTRGRCVECVVDTDCASGKCASQTCRISCSSDNTCTPQKMLCNTSIGFCVECNALLRCKAGLVCDPTGLCIPPICTGGSRICSDGGIATCLQDGSAYSDPVDCPDNSACKAASGAVACYEDTDGGTGCAIGGAPCEQIPRFTGTQTVDGSADDFCGVPSARFDAGNAAKVLSYHARPTEVATVRVAWSGAGIHIHVDVTDSAVQSVSAVDPAQAVSKIYQGDSIELMVSSNNSLTGLTGTDNVALHVTVPAAGPAVTVKTANINGASQGVYTNLPASQYANKITAKGYAVEMKLPWPGGAAPANGTAVRFDIVLNSADKNFGTVDDMRDGQLIYWLQSVSSTTCQGTGGDGTVPFCDDRTWCGTHLTQ